MIEHKENIYSFYSVSTPIFEGPLDLLLHLIEKAELDITLVSLAQVTDQYLQYIKHLDHLDAGDVSQFLVIAAKLLQIKSEILLPKPPGIGDDEDVVGEDLALQLRIYKRYKEIAKLLEEKEKLGWRTYLRLSTPPPSKSIIEIGEYSVIDLIHAASALLARVDERANIDSVIRAPVVTIREKISRITTYLRRHRSAVFSAVLGEKPTNIDVVVTFLAMPELIKGRFITVYQAELFGDIEIRVEESWNVEEDVVFEVEFGE